ncbi:MAG: DUF1775 domain-containing protein [Pseudomonadota bacterium]
MKLTAFAATAAPVLPALPTLSHATLEVQEAEVNSTYKGVMRVGHGCEGEATNVVRIQIPEGVIAVKPMPKPGWTLETVTGDYAQSYEYYGTHTEGVKEIVWTGELLDAHYDEFVFRARLTDALEVDQMLFFPTVQECASGEHAWIEIPAAGQDPHELESPAPGLMLIGGGHAHH